MIRIEINSTKPVEYYNLYKLEKLEKLEKRENILSETLVSSDIDNGWLTPSIGIASRPASQKTLSGAL
jgi:hypothetical protein